MLRMEGILWRPSGLEEVKYSLVNFVYVLASLKLTGCKIYISQFYVLPSKNKSDFIDAWNRGDSSVSDFGFVLHIANAWLASAHK